MASDTPGATRDSSSRTGVRVSSGGHVTRPRRHPRIVVSQEQCSGLEQAGHASDKLGERTLDRLAIDARSACHGHDGDVGVQIGHDPGPAARGVVIENGALGGFDDIC